MTLRPGCRGWVAAAVAVVVVAGAVAGWAWRRSTVDDVVVYGTVPEFSLIERSGRTVTRDDLLGKVSIVDFFYTSCPDACPLQSANMARLQAGLKNPPDLRLVSITVDPGHDTPEVLDAYARRFAADPARWLFLTGPRDDIIQLAVHGFRLAILTSWQPATGRAWAWLGPARAWAHDSARTEGGKVIRFVHASRFALVDRQARIRGYFDGLDAADVTRLGQEAGRLAAGRR